MAGRNFHSYRPADGHGLAHDPLNSIVGPRPIGWISSVSAAGVVNLAPYSFFNLFNYKPPLLGFSSIGWKDSVQNVDDTHEFVWNLATRDLADAMNATSADVSPEVDEFTISGLTSLPSELVSAPRVAEAPVSFECRVADVHRLRDAARNTVDAWLVIGEVMMIHIADDLLADGVYDTALARPILRGGGGSEYFEINPASRFDMRRPLA